MRVLVNLPNRVQICLFPKLGRLVPEFGELGYCVKYPSTLNSGTNLPNFENRQICTRFGKFTKLTWVFSFFFLD